MDIKTITAKMDPASKSIRTEYRYILLFIVVVLVFLLLVGSVSKISGLLFENSTANSLAISTFGRFIFLLSLVWIIGKLKLIEFTGITSFNSSDLRLLVFPLAIIGFGIASNTSIYSEADPELLILFMLSVVSVGFLEETFCRGIILPLLIRSRDNSGESVLFGVIASSVIFGLIHYIGLINENATFVEVSGRVVFAFSLGMYLGAIFLRTGNLLVPALIHASINFVYGTGDLREAEYIVTEGSTGYTSDLLTLLVFALIAYSGLHMLKRVDKEQVLEKVRQMRI